MSDLMSAESFGTIFAVGAIVYAVSLVINGPIVDKIGGKKGILIATLGAAAANIALGVATYFLMYGRLPFNMTLVFSILYGINMYFQSYGAVSIIKVKAYWFHVRERGVFGAIFGALISLGVYLAFDWGGAIVSASKVKVENPTWLQNAFQALFHVRDGSVNAIWLAYFIPAGIMIFFAVLDAWLIQDTPSGAGLEDFETHDASAGEMHLQFSMMDLLRKVFGSPILMLVGLVELTNGVVRNGIVNWYFPYLKGTNTTGAEFFHDNWGLLLFLGGIFGGFASGYVSDRWFHSRRGPPVVLSGISIVVLLCVMTAMLFSSPVGVGLCAVLIGFFTIAIHALMSGTAGADFGGRKATATAAGVTDGFVYLGAGIQSLALKQLTLISWQLWPLFLIPFGVLGLFFASRIWQALPEATKKYLLVVEKVSVTTEAGLIESTTVVEKITTS
jgi:OPA family glycerol-3-phosphate transporter-like MFS transporter